MPDNLQGRGLAVRARIDASNADGMGHRSRKAGTATEQAKQAFAEAGATTATAAESFRKYQR
ncbi:MAG: hypothetical protein JWR80_6371 [Bradyrhizobium sp.]|nr:hypothetical protein [Bradyrhizobium sp.]